jgi:transcriptional regulator with XRE-family HTH domain
MELADRIARRLWTLRRQGSVSQRDVGREIGLSISGFSRLERGQRHLHVDQLVAWAGALGLRVDIVLWTPVRPQDGTGAPEAARDDDDDAVLTEVAAALPHLPEPVKRALVGQMREWKSEALRRARIMRRSGAVVANAPPCEG